jgi:hypothetical protein
MIRRAVETKGRFTWLQPPENMGAITVVDVWTARDAAEHEEKVREWAASAWAAWSCHHATVRLWCASI